MLKHGQLCTDEGPKNRGRDMLVIVPQDVADPSDLRPGNASVTLFQVIGQAAACFGDDLNAALYQLLLLPIGLKAF